MKNEEYNNKKPSEKDIEKVMSLISKNKAAALGLAVMLTLSTALTGCGASQNSEEEEDDSYYSGGGHYIGGSYFYSPGGSYRSGSWGKSYSISGKSGYSSARGGSVGS